MESPSTVGLKFEVPSFDPRLYFVLRGSGGAAGAIATRIDDISGCGEPDPLLEIRRMSEFRFGKLKVRGQSLGRVGMELAREGDSSVTLAKVAFTKDLEFPPTFPKLRAGRMGPRSGAETKMRQSRSGEVFWLATVARPDIGARLAKVASGFKYPFASDVYRITDLV